MTLANNPAMLPTQVLLGLTSGKIFLFPNFNPNPNAAVSHNHTARKSANVIEDPRSDIFRNVIIDPNIIPSQIKENIKTEIFSIGVCFFRNISLVMAMIVRPINK